MKDAGRPEVIVPAGGPLITKVKGLFQTLTELQIISEGEKKSGDYNPDIVAPFATRLSFSVEGVHTGFHSIIFTYLMLPVVIGVLKNYFPAFGKYEHDLFEKCILYLLAFSPGVVKVFFTSYVLSQLYLGRTTKTIVDWFLAGLIPVIALAGIFGIFLYLAFYSVLLSTQNLYRLYFYCVYQKGGTFWTGLYKVIFGIKMSIPKAALLFSFYVAAEILVLSLAYFYAMRKTKMRKKLLEKYDIELESP